MGKDLNGKDIGTGFRQRPNGTYDVRAYINGRKIYLTNTNLAELRKEFNEKKKEVEKGNTIVLKRYTLDEWFAFWFETYKKPQIKETSVPILKSKYNRMFGRYIGSFDLKSIYSADIQKCISMYVNEEKARDELASAFSNLTECFACAVNNKLLKDNPCSLIIIPKMEKAPKDENAKFLNSNEENAFLDATKDDWYYNVFYTLFNTGMRISELCGLKWEDINFQQRYINIGKQLITQYYKGKSTVFITPKTQSGYRKVPFLNNMEQILRNQYKQVSERRLQLGDKWRTNSEEYSDLVFYSSVGSPLSKDTVYQKLRFTVNTLNRDRPAFDRFKHISPHMFRHSFAAKCYENGIDAKVTQKLLGHADVSTTMNIYTHLSENTFLSEVERLNNMKQFSNEN